MKRIIPILVCGLIAFASCQKSPLDTFCGDYSFKTSGSVTVQRMPTLFDSITPPAYTFNLPNEIGQLEISTLDKENDSVIVVMNYLNDEVIVARGRCKDNELYMKKFKRNALNLSIDYEINLKAPIRINATGHLYDGNTLIFDMTYTGVATVGNQFYTIDGDNIKMVAFRN